MRLFSQNTKVEALRKVPLFADLSRAQLTMLARTTEDVEVEEGRVLCREGDPGRDFFVVVDGEVVVRKKGRKLATLGAGDFFGELALLDQATRTATVTATTPVRFFVLTNEAFWPMVEANPRVAQKLLRTVAKRARAAYSDPSA